jgi:RimJ/RimL family protein N-acetyltransferase
MLNWKRRQSRHGSPGPRIVLRPFRERDVDRLIGWVGDESTLFDWAGAEVVHPLDPAQVPVYPERCETAQMLPFAVVRSHVSLDAIGHVSLADIDPRRRSLRLSRVIVGDPAQRGQGLGRAIVLRAAAQAFGVLWVNRIWTYVPSDNTAALRCFESAGFVREGLLRECAVRAGDYVDCLTMSLLAREWEKAWEAGRAAAPPAPVRHELPSRMLPSDTFHRAYPKLY